MYFFLKVDKGLTYTHLSDPPTNNPSVLRTNTHLSKSETWPLLAWSRTLTDRSVYIYKCIHIYVYMCICIKMYL